MRGVLFSVVSFALVIYEIIVANSPRIELVVGYFFVFAYGIFTIVSRHKRPDYEELETQSEE
jgi:Ca2+/Na+ antiporter